MGSEYRKPSASADEHYQHIPSASSPTAAASQQGTPPGSERIEEPSYQEHGVRLSGQPPVEAPSFYPADLPDIQLQQERWQAPPAQPQQKNGSYPSNQGQQAYGAVPPVPGSLPPQGPAPYAPMPQYQPNMPHPQKPAAYVPSGQPYRGAPIPYTNPQAYRHPSNGYLQQPLPPAYPGYPYQGPGYPYQGYYAPYGYQQRGYPGYPPPGYPVPPYVWYPPRPRRNGYQLGMAITSLVGSILVIIGGIFCGILLLGASIASSASKISSQGIFASTILYTSLMLAGIIGGAFGILHSSLALALRPSRPLKLPPFWSFLPIYILLVIVGLLVGTSEVIVNNFLVVFPLIALSGILPALTFFALALRRVRRPKTHEWPTTWRRFTLALVSGATSAIFLAVIFEGILTLIAAFQFATANTSFIDNPNAPIPHDPSTVIFNLMIVSVIAPIVEEGFKPLAVITMIGRIRSAAEAFILGMACGIGFDMIETTSYIGIGYRHWIDVAIDRSTAGLLHGFGAGMMALGWYYITHKDALKGHHLQIGLGCMLYAILQHAIWNGSFVLQLLPAPIGPYLESGTITIVNYQLDAFLIVYLVFSVLMLCFLWFVTGKIRLQPDVPAQRDSQATEETIAPVAHL
jgi:RsiW-degrading membrane proteinase PrsW (M82 family)